MKAKKKGIISSLTIVTLGLVIIHTPVEASGSAISNTITPNQSSTSTTQGNQSQWTTNLTGERYTTIAHRGASGYAPEHTFAAYDKSRNELGASYIEIDLQRTKDGHLVAMHDETVDRTTNGSGRVEDYTLSELKKLDAGSSFNEQHPQFANDRYKGATVPTLDEILTRYGTDANYYIETKQPDVYPGMEQQLLDTLDKHNMLNSNALQHGHVLIQSFSEASLLKMHQLNANVPLIRLLDKGELAQQSDADLQRIRSYAIGVGPEYSDLNERNTAHLKDLGFLVHPFTVNETADMQRLNQYGVDGVFTNYADQYKAISAQK
ncbi:glycerophosphodiester phosphodiesterase [Staphylococcus borealis]|uniref:glycerophosphodiester phosphodiesterase n=1 Tax=Staphylococcus borealis TaxID=2742203 RepID=UPI0015829123|nr:glycerophosphodiester phosphodiesterase [Staphylococcus borealis]NUI89778.1 glycerophosphodiester phosphodiesterase [Staphylococcus borealis]